MIVATAGHVDHGKTLLVKALTGVDTDRLPEEKRRGMTIDLGFAYLPLEGAETIGFIDVPGHERFIHNMLSGVGGIDFGLLIVAADDGPMPQTTEHLAIIDLLGVCKGAVALTKIDRVLSQRVVEMQRDIASLLSSTKLQGSPIFPVNALTGTGIEALKQHLICAARDTVARAKNGNFRMTVDRCFTVAGAGLVVTGTAISGALHTGEQVRLLPAGVSARIRSIHAQNTPSEICRAGQRCGVNLTGAGLGRDSISRGTWLAAGPVPDAVLKFDARLRVLASEKEALQHWTPVHVHMGALDVNGRVAVLEGSEIVPGASGLVQLVVNQPACVVRGDGFVIRDQSAQRTIGGGRVIDIFPPARNRAAHNRLKYLAAMEIESDSTAFDTLLHAATSGLRLDRFAANRNLTPSELTEILTRAEVKVVSCKAGNLAFTRERWKALKQTFLAALKAGHEGTAGLTALSEERIFSAHGTRLPREAAVAVGSELLREGAIVRDASGLRLSSHQPKLSAPDAATWMKLEPVLKQFPMRPPNTRELAGMLREDPKKVEAFLVRASRLGIVVQLSDNRFFLPEALRRLAEIVHKLAVVREDRLVTAADLRDKIGGGRKVAIEILEHFDRIKFTRRIGDAHLVLGEGVCYPASR